MARPGRFHYFRGEVLIQEENGQDIELMDAMREKLKLTWEDLLDKSNSSEYATGVVRVEGRRATVEFYKSAAASLQPSAQITFKQFDSSDPEFNLSPTERRKAEDAFRDWAQGKGYEPFISPLWSRPPEP
jgi:hypothetical protein